MKAFIASIVKKQWRIKALDRVEDTIHSMSLAEKVAWYGAFFVFAFASLQILSKVNDMFLITIPTRGGTLTEGIVGTPRFVNPLLDISDADRDLSSLVYSGLMKALPDGTLVPDLASIYSVSDDSLSYTFTLRDNLTWSDGQPITTDDIEFTILKAQDSGLKSPRRAMWEGVTIEKQSPTEIRFILRQPYALFLENTTMGILPKHIWKSIEIDEFPFSQFNVEPIGSGPFVVDSVKRNENGIPSRYELVPNDDYALGAPFIEKLIIQFYQNEKIAIENYKNGEVLVSALSMQKTLTRSTHTIQKHLSLVFLVSFSIKTKTRFFSTKKSAQLSIQCSIKTLLSMTCFMALALSHPDLSLH